MSSVLDFLIKSESPVALHLILEGVPMKEPEILNELDQLLSKGLVKCRSFQTEEGEKKVYWTPSTIPFIVQNPIITNPFSSPFDHQEVLQRLTDSQLQQEKTWLQTKLRKLNSEFENLQHLAKTKIDEQEEKNLDELTKKWMSAIHEMLWNLLSKTKNNNPDLTMDKLLKELRISPESVKWSENDEDFID